MHHGLGASDLVTLGHVTYVCKCLCVCLRMCAATEVLNRRFVLAAVQTGIRPQKTTNSLLCPNRWQTAVYKI
jgi:hypothetical protein